MEKIIKAMTTQDDVILQKKWETTLPSLPSCPKQVNGAQWLNRFNLFGSLSTSSPLPSPPTKSVGGEGAVKGTAKPSSPRNNAGGEGAVKGTAKPFSPRNNAGGEGAVKGTAKPSSPRNNAGEEGAVKGTAKPSSLRNNAGGGEIDGSPSPPTLFVGGEGRGEEVELQSTIPVTSSSKFPVIA